MYLKRVFFFIYNLLRSGVVKIVIDSGVLFINLTEREKINQSWTLD